jgi:CheY-like chemotaxis protein
MGILVGKSFPVRPLNILVVEDNVMIAMCLEDMLVNLKCTVVKATRLEKAMQELARGHFDGALLDVNIAGMPVYPLADALTTLAVPFAFVTGHEPDSLPAAYGEHPVLAKPLIELQIVQTIKTFTGKLPLRTSISATWAREHRHLPVFCPV